MPINLASSDSSYNTAPTSSRNVERHGNCISRHNWPMWTGTGEERKGCVSRTSVIVAVISFIYIRPWSMSVCLYVQEKVVILKRCLVNVGCL